MTLASDKTAAEGSVSPLWQLPSVKRYMSRIGAKATSLRVAAVIQVVGNYEKRLATIRFEKPVDGDWEVSSPQGCEPTEEELVVMRAELRSANLPEWQLSHGVFAKTALPHPYASLSDHDLYILRSAQPLDAAALPLTANSRITASDHHPIIMIQARLEKDAKKFYVPLTQWSDGHWHTAEPDRRLPVFGLELLHYTSKSVAFLHEGAKAARAAQAIADAFDIPAKDRNAAQQSLAAHTWAFEIAAGVHLGWIGGALRPDDTDWRELRAALRRAGVTRVVIVGDNDKQGREALPEISHHLEMTVDHVIFPATFPPAFDLADNFPTGAPAFAECLQPGTWLTKLIPNPKGKPTAILTDAGREEYLYLPEVALYVNRRHPRFAYDKERLNATLRPLSHSANTSALIEQAAYSSGRAVGITYDPGLPSGIVTDGEVSALNRHQPTTIRPIEGDPAPWLQFLSYLFPIENSRAVVMDWCATLIGRPELRMHFGILLISQKQGVGKTTLGDVMAELVGRHNASFPGENDVLSPFNEWQAEKRLAVVNEIYTGHSWKAYNTLKTVLTDRFLTINRKHQRQYKVPNWLHIIACSNSARPLKMEDGDRRWFVPEVTEVAWSREQFAAFRDWLTAGGYGIILAWARSHPNYIQPGQHAPASGAKEVVVAAGRSESAQAVIRLAETMAVDDNAHVPLAVTLRAVAAYARRAGGGRLNEDNQELGTLLKKHGVTLWARIKVKGPLETVYANAAAHAAARTAPPENQNKLMVGFIKLPATIAPEDM